MSLTELAKYLDSLFPGKAPTRQQLDRSHRTGVFHVEREKYNLVAKKVRIVVPPSEVEKVVQLCKEGAL